MLLIINIKYTQPFLGISRGPSPVSASSLNV